MYWKSRKGYLNGTNEVSVRSLIHTRERSLIWLFFSSSMLLIQQKLRAASSNAQQMCKDFFRNTISIITIGCESIVGRLSKELSVLEPHQDFCAIATLLPLIHHEALKTKVRPLGLLVKVIEGNNCVSIPAGSLLKGRRVFLQ
jgi:hypothetical protein